jgi:3-oxoacyl-[acyl-carrier protein] reductase
MKKFDKIQVGDKAEIKHKITQDDINKFVDLTGDDNKLHLDSEYAKKTSFKKPVAHGMLSATFISTIIGTKLPGDGALWFSQSFEFLLPVRVGDQITIKAEVIKKEKRTNSIELTTDIFNQNKEKVTSGIAKVKVIEQVVEKTNDKLVTLKEKVALVVGGTGGIGRATCIQLAKDGFKVAIHYHNNIEGAKDIKKQIVALGGNAIVVQADITKISEISNMVSSILRKLNTITVLANCSTSHLPNIKFQNLEWTDIQKQLDINILGTFNLLKSITPVMIDSKYGKVINISTQAIEKINSDWSHYITAKSALNGFSKALALELAPKGIRINLVSPGMTDTDLVANMPEKIKLLSAAQTPLRRIAQPEDIANAISFLASTKSDYLSGETIRVNGGQVML